MFMNYKLRHSQISVLLFILMSLEIISDGNIFLLTSNNIYTRPCFINVTFLEKFKVISSLFISDGFAESIYEYYIIVSDNISRITSKDFVKLTFNLT